MQASEKALIQGLVHVIWADGEVSDEERRLLGGVLTQLDLDEKSLQEVSGMLRQPPDLQGFKEAVTDPEARREIFKVFVAMALADGQVVGSETRLLSKIAAQLDLSPQEIVEIQRETLAELQS